ncbi:MAG TPA: hypothetical protein VKZ91_04205 [Woeseiaceae bacterium]|nr:hypothetical protein [Woeseiaceae bacterium]
MTTLDSAGSSRRYSRNLLALGLFAFGVYSLIESVYRKADVPA